MVIVSIWNATQGHFSPLICSLWHVRTCLLFPQTMFCWNETDYPSASPQGRRGGVLLFFFDGYLYNVLTVMIQWAWCTCSGVPCQGEGTASLCLSLFSTCLFWAGSIAICCIGSLWRRDLINTGSRGQRSRQRKDWRANMLHRPCNVVIKGWCQHCG